MTKTIFRNDTTLEDLQFFKHKLKQFSHNLEKILGWLPKESEERLVECALDRPNQFGTLPEKFDGSQNFLVFESQVEKI